MDKKHRLRLNNPLNDPFLENELLLVCFNAFWARQEWEGAFVLINVNKSGT